MAEKEEPASARTVKLMKILNLNFSKKKAGEGGGGAKQ